MLGAKHATDLLCNTYSRADATLFCEFYSEAPHTLCNALAQFNENWRLELLTLFAGLNWILIWSMKLIERPLNRASKMTICSDPCARCPGSSNPLSLVHCGSVIRIKAPSSQNWIEWKNNLNKNRESELWLVISSK